MSGPELLQLTTAHSGRACQGEFFSGDLAYIREDETSVFLALLDVAGHGRAAYRLAHEIETLLSEAADDDLVSLIEMLHQILLGKNGAVIILGRYDRDSGILSFIQIGDTHARIFGPRARRLVSQEGMLGHAIPTPIVSHEQLSSGDTVVFCTDGISVRYDLVDIQGRRSLDVLELAEKIIQDFGKQHDDATCVVWRCS